MYKTTWQIIINKKDKVLLEFWHFGNVSKFPTWYLKDCGRDEYAIKMLCFKKQHGFNNFLDCLFKSWRIS